MLLLAMAAAPALAQPANNCADPYWKDTLRCVFFPNERPQENRDSIPNVPADFTRVFLDRNLDVRCTDGTRPLIYVDKAVSPRGEPIESNKWVFTMTGGDSCSGERCAFMYAQGDERGFMGSSTKPAMRDMEGIHDPDPARNPVFAAYNRVRVEKCSFDRYMGRSQELGVHATAPNGTPITYNAYHHGFLIMQEAFKALEKGLRYTTWRREPGDGKRRPCCGRSGNELTPFEETLPPLANAEVVLFIGHSNASHGLYHNVDNLAAALGAIPGFRGDVRALFDENFLPSFENEAAFAGADRNAYSGVRSGTSTARGEQFTYDGERYHATDNVDAEYAAHGAAFDASCLDAHRADGAAWKCRDRQHVLFNHITTPFMIREDFTDPNREHLDAPDGHPVRWGDARNFSYCPTAEPCLPRFNAAEFRARLEAQIGTLLTSFASLAEIATHYDRSAEPVPSFYVWMPSCGQHDGSFTDNPFYNVTIATDGSPVTMRQWLEDFMAAPRSGVRRYRIDGAPDGAGRRMVTTRCQN